jgi:hypothetical protein
LKLIDLINQKFGKLTVIKRAENHIRPNGARVPVWVCQCNCGNITNVEGAELRKGTTQSCGCLQRELQSKRKSKYNTYDLSGEYGIGYTLKGEEFYFDLEDYDKIKNYCWRKRYNDGMFDAKVKIEPNKRILLHKLILDTNLQVDHIEHNRYDNRKSKLRIVNNSQNQMNKGLQKNNKSGCKGVIWHKRDQIWESYISKNSKRIYLGRYVDLKDAIRIRKQAEGKYFGEYNYKEINKTEGINVS